MRNLYDVGSSPPQLVSLLPGDLVGPCGTEEGLHDDSYWISDNGSLVYFEARAATPCVGLAAPSAELYVRDIPGNQTKLISGPQLSGPDCGGDLVKSTPGAVFFTTQSRLDPEDVVSSACSGGNDVYRYDIGDGTLDCLTCVIADLQVDVVGAGPDKIAVSDDGSRLYFTTTRRLLPDAPADGQSGVYRIGVASGELAYIVPGSAVSGAGGTVGTAAITSGLSADGTVLVFSSDADFVNPLGGVSDNDGGIQYYRYSDSDRSLVCASCPQDGSPPGAELEIPLHVVTAGRNLNGRSLSADGGTFAFVTPVPLVGADQNTPPPGDDPSAGTDVYEWRDGRPILVTDGLTNWALAPAVMGVSPAGHDVYFVASAAYTPDAPDALPRLYDARIGGGFSFPKPPPPCPLEVCQGTPKGAPEEQEPASRNFSGSGNLTATTARRCPKGKRKVSRGGKARCVKKQRPRKQHRAANHDRRANR